MTYQNFNHFIKAKPHEIHEVFISDLHLDEKSLLVDAFLAFLDLLSTLPNLKKLYILGDWFEVWIGDDEYLNLVKRTGDTTALDNHWITPIVSRLKKMRIAGCHTLVLTGNRDFLMRQPFCNTFAGEMIQEPYFVSINQQTYRLEHGDVLCTDDKDYQRFRKFAHNPIVQWWLLSKSIDKRLAIADKMRAKSKNANANKSTAIMDVNPQAVQYAFDPQLDNNLVKLCKKKNKPIPPSSDAIIHGHTHRPDIHPYTKNTDKTRYVLGDWRLNTTELSSDKSSPDESSQIELNKQNIDNTSRVTAVIAVVHSYSYKEEDTHTLHNHQSNTFELMEYHWVKEVYHT